MISKILEIKNYIDKWIKLIKKIKKVLFYQLKNEYIFYIAYK